MDPLSTIGTLAGGLFGQTGQSGPTALESQLEGKNSSVWGSSFAVGSGATATSSPTLSTSAGAGIPREYLLAGGLLVGAAVLAVILRK